jgi:hypothetical protein
MISHYNGQLSEVSQNHFRQQFIKAQKQQRHFIFKATGNCSQHVEKYSHCLEVFL